MSSDHTAEPPVIRVRGLGKSYKISHQTGGSGGGGAFTLAEAAMRAIRRPLGMFNDKREIFWALREVDLDIHEAEVLGIIGRNGAGKSTLLKLLSRITRPTVGHFELRGRVGSLLEVGTGFHPELTGRENIFLNGTILGMTRSEVRANFDEIVDFSGIERFLDTPVKRYSSGMYVRLAFAVAAHLEPEILIVDEVLAVGDAEFQKKCLGKMRDVASGGRTVIFVSHNMAAVQNLCTRCVWIAAGKVEASGEPESVIEAYNRSSQVDAVAERDLRELRRESGKQAVLRAITIHDDSGRPTNAVAAGREVLIRIDYESASPLERPFFGITLENPLGVKVLWLNSNLNGPPLPDLPARGSVTCRLPRLMLVPGVYRINIGCGTGSTQLDHIHAAGNLQVLDADVFGTGRLPRADQAVALHEADWTSNQSVLDD